MTGLTDEQKWKLKKVGIFIQYMIIEPFRQFLKPKAWMYICLIGFFIALVRGQMLEQMIMFALLLFLIAWSEWESGKFMEWYRRRLGKVYKQR